MGDKGLTRFQALTEATGLELLADMEEDFDNKPKARRLRKQAKIVREKYDLGEAVVVEGQVVK